MGGVNLQDGFMEVALEQWIERCHNYNKTVPQREDGWCESS